ncbi:hypothetical protein TrRE_jg4467 [Triparma retinervis]|uniref:EF-hand domain-containing protein n=1 Tax=Triparma retinervis TaxID=2557542 RepID=A0A9W7EHP3_9STRA|nr:hypothetical protein TrRE_jg4467 [Triparma retinervis]
MTKSQLARDSIQDEWWDNQEKMTSRMARSVHAKKATGTSDPTPPPGNLSSPNQLADSSVETGLDGDDSMLVEEDSGYTSLAMKSNRFDASLPQRWDENDALGKALRKVSVSAVKYNRDKDGVYINAFRGGAMNPVAFRLEMRRSLGIKLTDEEFSVLVAEFDEDGDGTINGSEFLVQFMSIGFKEKSRIAYRRRERERKKRLADKMEAKRKKMLQEEKMEMNITTDFSKDDLQSALAKIQQVAGDYDATSASAMSLQGFLGTPLTPGNLRDMLRRTFNLRLSGKEIGAMMSAFDQDASGTLDGSEFLINFKKLGFKERTLRAKQQRENTTAMNKHFDELEAEREAAKKKASDNSFTFKYTSEDLRNALQKLANKSADYDPTSAAALNLSCFQGARMEPHTFKELCGVVFQINFPPAEMGALMHEFDKDGDGTVDGSEFLVKFTQLGFAEKNERFRRRKEFDERKRQKEIEREKARLAKQAAEDAKKVALGEVKDEDWKSAMAKITAAAADYDKMSASAMSLQAFQGSAMHPPLFRDMIFRTFGVTLNAGEAGAVIKYFDKDGDGTVDGTEFLLLFTKLGFNEKTRRFKERKKEKERRDALDKIWWEKREMEIQQNNEKKVDRSFTPAHKELALKKIAACAIDFNVDPISSLALQAFQGSVMQPHVFKEMLKRTFELKLSPGELGAVISIFDQDGDGEVDGAEFLNQFFRIKHQERDRRAESRRERQRRADMRVQMEAEKKERERIEKLNAKTRFTADERLSALKKIKDEALRRGGVGRGEIPKMGKRAMTAPGGGGKRKGLKSRAGTAATPNRRKRDVLIDEWEGRGEGGGMGEVREQAKPAFFFPNLMSSPIAMPSLKGKRPLYYFERD